MKLLNFIVGTHYLEEHHHLDSGDERLIGFHRLGYWKNYARDNFGLCGIHIWFYFWQEAFLIYFYWKKGPQ